MPADPIAIPLAAAVAATWLRSARSCSPASVVFAHGSVETSSTDSISSGLISPDGAGSSMLSIALTSSSDSASRIISSSSIPIVYAGPVNRCSTARSLDGWLDGRCNRICGRGALQRARGSLDLTQTNRISERDDQMALGYDGGKLYVLAFDHRGSFQKKMFGIEGDPTPEQIETIADAKRLIFEGMQEAVARGVEARGHRRAGRRAVRLRHPREGPRSTA